MVAWLLHFINLTSMLVRIYCSTHTVCLYIHKYTALTPKKIQEFFAPIIKLAINLKNRASKLQKSGQPPQEPLIAVSRIIA